MEKIMMLLICLWVVAGFLIACEQELTRHDIVRQNIENKLIDTLNDPNSYEFVSLTLIDSVLYKDNIQYRIEYFQERIETDQTLINIISDQQRIDEYNERIRNSKKVIEGIDSIKTVMGNGIYNVASYTYAFNFRATNEYGGLVLNEYIVQTDPAPSYQVINIADDEDRVYFDPNLFPGYRELVERFLYDV